MKKALVAIICSLFLLFSCNNDDNAIPEQDDSITDPDTGDSDLILDEVLFEASDLVSGAIQLFTVKGDGTGLIKLTEDSGQGMVQISSLDASWSNDKSKIVFISNREGDFEIFMMGADGSNVTKIDVATEGFGTFSNPKFSPDGSKVLFDAGGSEGTQLYMINIDGTNQVQLTTNSEAAINNYASWSPDGSKIVYIASEEFSNDGNDIFIMKADGTDKMELTTTLTQKEYPTFSPDGSKILLTSFNDNTFETHLFSVNSNGGDLTQLTNNVEGVNVKGSWSPDGSRIVFENDKFVEEGIYTMKADGSDIKKITDDSIFESKPEWR